MPTVSSAVSASLASGETPVGPRAFRSSTEAEGTKAEVSAQDGKLAETSNVGELIEYFIIFYPSISPNGDGVQDSSLVKIRPAKSCNSFSLTLEDTLSGSTIDTILSLANPDTIEYKDVWDGKDSLGAMLPEGCYKLHLHASSDSTTENFYSFVFVDTTTPTVHLDSIEPGIYTPGVPGTPEKIKLYYTNSGFSAKDSLRADVIDADGNAEEVPVAGKVDGHYSVEWSTSENAPDGFYTVSFVASDNAGNKSISNGTFEVDTAPPAIAFIDSIPTSTNHPAELVKGSCFDRNGVKDLILVWCNADTIPPDTTYMSGDTLIWTLNIADSIKANGSYIEKQYSLKVLCNDTFGHENTKAFTFTIDITPPPAPVLHPIPSSSLESEITISGSVDESEADSIVVYYTSGVDTVSISIPLLAESFSATVELSEETTTIWAVAKDKAGNVSAPSNFFTVKYSKEDAYSFPEVFRGADHFVIYTKEQAQSVEIEIFSIDGRLVRRMQDSRPATKFDLRWNLRNDDGEPVKNGPYLVVFKTSFGSSRRVDKKLIAVVR